MVSHFRTEYLFLPWWQITFELPCIYILYLMKKDRSSIIIALVCYQQGPRVKRSSCFNYVTEKQNCNHFYDLGTSNYDSSQVCIH
jgi:hypothetical protein